MAPAALAIPQFAAGPYTAPDKISNDETPWNSSNAAMGDCALDFDLLAEYLLEDMGSGFDFGASPEAVATSTIDTLKTQPTAVVLPPQDPTAVVTPNPISDKPAFVDPLALADVAAAAQLQQPQPSQGVPAPLPAGGDLAGELSQVQQMIAATQQQQATNAGAVAAPQQPHLAQAPPAAQPQPPLAQHQQAPQAAPQPQLAARPLTQPVAPTMMSVRHPPPQQPKPAPAAPVAVGAPAPITQQRAAPSMAQPLQANKRPRVAPPPVAAKSKVGGYSFAASIASVNGANGAMRASAIPPTAAHHAIPGVGGRQNKSQTQIDRRRERNRILARRTRLRKKFFFESLQKDVADLQRENAALKSIVRSRLRPDDARALLSRCDANERLPSAIQHDGEGIPLGPAAGAGDPGVKKLDREDFSLIRSIQNSQQCFIITDPSLHDNPIVYASDDFLTLTGYSQEEVLGRNCRFLQGTETCPEKVARVGEAVKIGEDVSVTMANYRSDGTPFWNSLFIAALRDAENNIVNFIGVIVKVAGPEPGDSEYGKVLK
eukprot:CAMPEP_0172530532 /NCGR_PEP_ID=MMETSP1067-20121228/4239_1 /TAXON_ID=265564 ORGANISM="Thalassiosira punctigera, Strain Tpunct2005C2" /NCGR_SAMPLE_ID=MMETSP1067 /ASSEMBLY_ACC=CAM_ASM_000444 /LENGTH=544 /DNA_ID=CAMNT_0013314759 /DNA_START=252 /DNA_END=1886 /DNA_ORIENTATION=+